MLKKYISTWEFTPKESNIWNVSMHFSTNIKFINLSTKLFVEVLFVFFLINTHFWNFNQNPRKVRNSWSLIKNENSFRFSTIYYLLQNADIHNAIMNTIIIAEVFSRHNYIKHQESIIEGCQLPACRPYTFHYEHVCTCRGWGCNCTLSFNMNKLKHVWTGRLGLGSCMGVVGGFGGGTPPVDRQIHLKTLPSPLR